MMSPEHLTGIGSSDFFCNGQTWISGTTHKQTPGQQCALVGQSLINTVAFSTSCSVKCKTRSCTALCRSHIKRAQGSSNSACQPSQKESCSRALGLLAGSSACLDWLPAAACNFFFSFFAFFLVFLYSFRFCRVLGGGSHLSTRLLDNCAFVLLLLRRPSAMHIAFSSGCTNHEQCVIVAFGVTITALLAIAPMLY